MRVLRWKSLSARFTRATFSGVQESVDEWSDCEGHIHVNESALTGESIPVDREKGMRFQRLHLNQSGFLKCEATRVGERDAFITDYSDGQ